jgi:methylenetetrahydrofolate reductase (NADPH)
MKQVMPPTRVGICSRPHTRAFDVHPTCVHQPHSGYPEGHLECTSLEDDLRFLKEKVDAGADFVISQLFYDVDLFLGFVQRARDIGIRVPIIPGIMPIQNYQGFKRMTGFCKTAVPQQILDALEPIKDDDAAVKAYGIQLGVDMCRQLLSNGIEGLHFYTLNLERSTIKIMEGLELIDKKDDDKLPWSQVQHHLCLL